MWFPNAKLKIEKNLFKIGNNVVYRDKEGNEHDAKVLDVMFKSLNIGYKYLIELNEPINDQTKFMVSETSLIKKSKNKKQ
jgi:hypothetical protein